MSVGRADDPSPDERRALLERLLRERAEAARTFPLSFAQERLWFVDQLVPGSSLYNMPAAVRVTGPLNVRALEWSFNEVVARHESLRTTFSTLDGRPVQRIARSSSSSIPVRDLGGLSGEERRREVRRLAAEEARRPFDLARGPLLRVSLLRLDDEEHVLLMTMHHIVSDGWSMGVLVRELAAFYSAASAGNRSQLPPLPIQYADFAQWQRDWLQGDALEAQLGYWRKQLAGLPVLELPTDRPRPPVQTHCGATRSFALPADLSESLKGLSRAEGATLFMTMLAAFQILLGRYANQRDVVVGSPTAGRNRPELQGLIGFFVNMLALRTDLSGDPDFLELLARVRESCQGAYAHQDLPFERLVEELRPDRDLSRSPLFQVMFVLQNLPASELKLPGGPTLGALKLDSGVAKFDLTLSVWESGEELGGEFEYNTDQFDSATIERMIRHYRMLLEGIVADPRRPISRLPLLDEEERQRILVDWNASETEFSKDACIHELFEAHARRSPETLAVVHGQQELSYGELDRRANRLAHHLRTIGVGPEVLVGICVERSPEMLVGILGVLKAGGAYVPLDPDYPAERLAYMLEDAGAPVLLTQQRLLERLPENGARTVCLDSDWRTVARCSDAGPETAVASDNLAYAIYTSGSTGRPKGTLLGHHGLCNLSRFQRRAFDVRPESRVLQFSSLSYDASVWETVMALANGACLVLADAAQMLPGPELVRVLREQQVSIVTIPPSVLSVLPWEEFPDLETIVVAGEKCTAELVSRWSGGRRFVNAYGPTESTVCATLRYCSAEETTDPPIGGPIANHRVYVLDAELNPLPVGVAGELHIGGVGLARGYLNRPELTAEKFVPHPFGEPGARLYRTGDLCRWLADGTIEFLGRIDQQVKLHGIRIELGEIEAVLAEHPAVARAVSQVREETPGERRLVAYCVAAGDEELQPTELRGYARGRLPSYMVPSVFIMLPELPLQPNGKLDRKALPAPERAPAAREQVAPRTPVEERLAEIWREVLGVERVGVHDNFFELGGHSLLATQLLSRLRASFEVELPLRKLFEADTIAALAQVIETAEQGLEGPPIEPVGRDRPLPLSFAQERLWFLDQLVPGSSFYNMPAAVRIAGALDTGALEKSFNEVVRRHEVLRTTFAAEKGRPLLRIAPSLTLSIPVVELGGLSPEEREIEVRRRVDEEAARPFDLVKGPLLRVSLLRLGDSEHVLLVTMHHVVSDGWSMGLFVREISLLYDAFREGKPSPLPEPRIQYADFAHWQRQWLDGEVLERQLGYWKEQLRDLPVLELPTDHTRPAVRTFHGASHPFELPAELSAELGALCEREGITPFMALLAAFQLLLGRYTGQEDVAVGSPIAGRNRVETEGLIGFFVNSLVLRTDLGGNPTFRELLARVREVCLGGFAHQELPFERLVEELRPERDLSRESLFQVMFVLQNLPLGDHELSGGATLSPVPFETHTSKFDLTFSLSEASDRLSGSIEYNTDLFEPATIARMAEHFRTLLQQALEAPERRLSELSPLTAGERTTLLVEWNDTASGAAWDGCVHHRFEACAERSPDAAAVAFDGEELSYRELNERSNRLAHYLIAEGVAPDRPVGLCVERSPELAVGILGILKAGGAYVPLDPTHPPERLAFMLADIAAPVVLTQERFAEKLRADGTRVVRLDAEREVFARRPAENPDRPVTPNHLAYAIYTSGSTGRPKGVEIPHSGLANLVAWHQREYRVQPADRATQVASPAFDASVWELWPYLTAGAGVWFPDETTRSSPAALVQWLADRAITLCFLPTPLAEAVLNESWPEEVRLRALLTGGDRLRRSPGERLPCPLVNHYGPTENTVVTTFGSVEPDSEGPPPIGRPIADTQVYLLDRHLQPVPVGAVGELHVGGASLARGYMRRPELTAESFIPDPFGEPGSRIYRTGDLCRYRSDGRIEFLDRIDHQVKVRGFRIEPGEIEAALAEHPGVQRALVLAREDAPGERRLVAYVVPAGEPPAVAGLRGFLGEKLPDYMVPAFFVMLDDFPLTPNGKIERKALPQPTGERPELQHDYVAPRTPTEERLARIWSEVLGVERVGVHDGFFELGGHSLSAVRVMAEIQEQFSRKLPLTALFQGSTIEQLAVTVENGTEEAISSSLLPIRPTGSKRPFFCVHQDMGLALGYIPLAGHLDEERPFYGLQAGGLGGDEEPSTRVEEMASRYIDAMRTVQPEGPYLVGGHSFGGYVAFEIARRLRERGERVELLALIDTAAPNVRCKAEEGAADFDDAARLADNARTIERFGGVELGIDEEKLRSLGPDEQLEHFLDKVRAARAKPDAGEAGAALLDVLLAGGAPLVKGSLDVSKACTRAVKRYVAGPYDGRITLLRSTEQPPALREAALADPSMGWDGVASLPTEVHILPGDHQSMIAEPHVRALAETLQTCIDGTRPNVVDKE